MSKFFKASNTVLIIHFTLLVWKIILWNLQPSSMNLLAPCIYVTYRCVFVCLWSLADPKLCMEASREISRTQTTTEKSNDHSTSHRHRLRMAIKELESGLSPLTEEAGVGLATDWVVVRALKSNRLGRWRTFVFYTWFVSRTTLASRQLPSPVSSEACLLNSQRRLGSNWAD